MLAIPSCDFLFVLHLRREAGSVLKGRAAHGYVPGEGVHHASRGPRLSADQPDQPQQPQVPPGTGGVGGQEEDQVTLRRQ